MGIEVSNMVSGGTAQPTDYIPASRGGQPVRLTPGQLRAGSAVTGGKLVLLGDSLFQQGIEAGVTGTNGWQTTAQQRSPVNWMQYMLGSPFDHTFTYTGNSAPSIGHNAGVGGNQTKDMIARFDTDVRPHNPDVLFIIGGTNDIANSQTQTHIIAQLKELVDRGLAIGCKQVVLFSIPPRIAGGWSGGQETIRIGVNTAMKTYLASFGERTKFIDQDPVLLLGGTGSAGDPTLFQTDGIHYSPYGAYKIASQLLVPWWQAYSGQTRLLRGIPSAYDVTTAPNGQLLINPAYTGTGGSKGTGVTGTTPTSWHAARDIGSTVTADASIVSGADWNGDTSNFIQMVYTAGGAGAAGELLAVRPTATLTTGVVTGNWYQAEVEVIVSDFTGVNPLESVFARLTDLQGDDTLVSAFGSKVSSGDVWPTGSEFNGTRLLLRTPPIQADGPTGLTLSLFARIDGTKTGTATVRWGTPVIKRVLTPTWYATRQVGNYNSGGLIAVTFGNSFQQAGNVGQDGPNGYTNRAVVETCMAACGAPFKFLRGQGVDGNTSTQILSRVRTYLAVNPNVNVVIINGFSYNDMANGISLITTNANALALINEVIAGGRTVIWFTDPITDSNMNGNGRTRYFGHLDFIMSLKIGGLIIVPSHESYNPKGGGTLVAKSYVKDGLHPTAVGVMKGYVPGAKKVIPVYYPAAASPFPSNDYYNNISYNPLLAGVNTNGSGSAADGWWYRSGGPATTGPGPNAFGIGVTGGVSVVVSKVAHPAIPGWGAGEASLPCVKLAITSVAAGSVSIGMREMSIISWTSGQAIAGPYNVVRPTTPNGCLYRPLSNGNLSTGSDPTGTWSTAWGEEFTSGNVTLQVIRDFLTGDCVPQGFADLYFSNQVGLCSLPELNLGFYDTAINPFATRAGSNGAYSSLALTNVVGVSGTTLPTSYGDLLGLDYIEPHMTIRTRPNEATPIEQYGTTASINKITCDLKIHLGPSAALDMVITQLGAYIAN